MNRLLLICLLLPGLVVTAKAQDAVCPKLLKNEADLNKVFDASNLVFIAQIEPRNSLNQHIYNFHRLVPVLKGDVPESGHLTYSDQCEPMSENGIYLFMLNRLDERIEGFNAILVTLPDGGPGFRWVAEWIETKVTSDSPSHE